MAGDREAPRIYIYIYLYSNGPESAEGIFNMTYEESSRNNRRRGTKFTFELVRFLSNFRAFSGPCYPHFGSFLRVWSSIGRKLEQGSGRRCVLANFWSQLCCQNVPRGSQDAPKLAILAPKCDQDGQLGGPNEAFEKLQGHFSGSWTLSYEKIDKH